MSYQILASDYDNTLVPFGEPHPRPEVVRAIRKMQAAGGRFVLSTGRAYPSIREKGQLGGLRYDYAITCNGACVVDKNGSILAEHPLTNEEMYALVDFCEDYNYPLQFDFRDACYAYCEYDYLRRRYAQMNSAGLRCLDGEDQDRHLLDMPHAAFAAMPPEAAAAFAQKYGHLNLHFMMVGSDTPEGYRFFDIVRGGIDKGVGLADLCEKMGLTLADAVAAGDSANETALPTSSKNSGFTARRPGRPAETSALHGRNLKRKRCRNELCTGLQPTEPCADPRHMAQPQEPGDGLLLRPSAEPVLADAGGTDRRAGAGAGGHRRQKADHPPAWAGTLGYAGKLHHHGGVGCVHQGCGAQRHCCPAAEGTHRGGVLQRSHGLSDLYQIPRAGQWDPGGQTAQHQPGQRRLPPGNVEENLGRGSSALVGKITNGFKPVNYS